MNCFSESETQERESLLSGSNEKNSEELFEVNENGKP